MIDQTAKHYRDRRVVGVKCWYYNPLTGASTTRKCVPPIATQWEQLPALGLTFCVLFFEEQYRIWVAERGVYAIHNYVRILPEDVSFADHVWLVGDGGFGDHYRYGLIDSVPPDLASERRKLGTMVQVQDDFRRIWNEVSNSHIWAEA